MSTTPTPTPRPLTPRQASVLRMIAAYIDANGWPPSITAIAADQLVCTSVVRVNLRALERKGWIARGKVDGRALPRAIEVVHRLPVLSDG